MEDKEIIINNILAHKKNFGIYKVREHHWVAQTRPDEFGRTIQIWRVKDEYYACIA